MTKQVVKISRIKVENLEGIEIGNILTHGGAKELIVEINLCKNHLTTIVPLHDTGGARWRDYSLEQGILKVTRWGEYPESFLEQKGHLEMMKGADLI